MSKIIIKLKGKQREIKVVGVPGGQCKSLSAPFEKIVGGTVVSSTPTAEMHQPPQITSGLNAQIGL